MAPRGRTPKYSDDVDRSYDSSPDPLSLSMNENTARPARQTSPRKPLRRSSPSKQNRRSSVTELDLPSPSKSMVVNTPRMGSASPWRIKVTVQAEPGSDEENTQSPSIKRVMRTQTTTVPLKDPDASSPVKRGRGRPRKSDIGTATKPKRVGTPAKRAARSKSRDVSAGALETSTADLDTDAPPKRKRGRPRKSVLPPTEDESTVAGQQDPLGPSDATPEPIEQNFSAPKGKATRFTSSRASTPVAETPEHIDLGEQLRTRKGTPHAKKVVAIPIESDEDSDVLTPTSGEEDEEPEEPMEPHYTQMDVQENAYDGPKSLSESQTQTYVSPNEQRVPTSVQEFEDEENEVPDVTTYPLDEGATRLPDDTTIIDSENFSMISVDSLPSSGGLTSPPKPEENNDALPSIGSVLQNKHLQPVIPNASNEENRSYAKSSPSAKRVLTNLGTNSSPARPAIRRYITPVIDNAVPSAPPAIAPVQPVVAKGETPRLGRVVTAGVALQGVLDPARLTPGPTQKVINEERDRLDDLFRGFSEGTRKELQAGLRLGEQLANDPTEKQPSPTASSPIKTQPKAASRNGVFKTERKYRQPRLLTPEDQDGEAASAAAQQTESTDVQYPSLNVEEPEKSLLSPASSEDEMSWRVDTPPVATGNTERMRLLNVGGHQEEPVAHESNSNTDNRAKPVQEEDHSDIWQEEASRSSSLEEVKDDPKVEDLFEPGPAAPARGKLPRTWRRKSGNHFQYSDEAESPQQPSPVQEHTEKPSTHHQSVQIVEQGPSDDEDAASDTSDASDDTGVFFQSNLPNLFNKRHSRELKQKKADKLDLTLLMNEGESLVPESSPPVATKKSSSASKNNPFLDTPPRFTGHLSSPQKSSPLRRELRGSDISSQSPSHLQEESSLPLPQSSPFHTFVDGQSYLSIASDQRQIQMEMEGVTDSSIRRVRNEADQYLEAYEPQERSLNEIEEVTEHSRTWHKTSAIPSSPPQMKMLSPVRKRVPLFGTPDKLAARPQQEVEVEQSSEMSSEGGVHDETEASVDSSHPELSTETPSQRPTGLLTRMTSSLWSAVTRPTAPAAPSVSPPEPHPILAKLTPLPKIEPWTKTHYKTLDKLYSIQYKHPALFSPSITPATPLSRTNKHLLQKFLSDTKKPYIGARFSAWGYEMDMTEELVVLCAVYMELLSLDNIAAYEALKGREIEMGECKPGKAGDAIHAEEVVNRLATVVLGEEVRKDERRGVVIDRSRTLEVEWPEE